MKRRTGCVLERVAHGVADDGGLVRLRTFAEDFDRSGVGALGLQVAGLDVLLGVVPGAAYVLKKVARRIPVIVPIMRRPLTASQPEASWSPL